jgi:hypothetical protein
VPEQEAYWLSKIKEDKRSEEFKELGRDKISSRHSHADCYSCWDDGLDIPYGACDTPIGGPEDRDQLERN